MVSPLGLGLVVEDGPTKLSRMLCGVKLSGQSGYDSKCYLAMVVFGVQVESVLIIASPHAWSMSWTL